MDTNRIQLMNRWLARHGRRQSRPYPARRIGIYAGSFDPVHAGHLGFALQALELARLDQVVFLPERLPAHKPGVEHYAHRVAMLARALRPHPRLSVLELVDRRFSVKRTLPQLQVLFAGDELLFLLGSDVLPHVPDWPYSAQLLKRSGLVVGARAGQRTTDMKQIIDGWSVPPHEQTVISSFAPDITSTDIRQALRRDQPAKGLLSSVRRYAKREWLYVTLNNS